MPPPFDARLDRYQAWCAASRVRLDELDRFLVQHDLRDAAVAARVDVLRQRLGADRRMVAVVGEFSRGKSELINALLADSDGRRMLPATPGRTTMCPVELGYTPGTRPAVAMLPIETRRDGATLAELRDQPACWTRFEFDDPADLAGVLVQVAQTRAASVDEARELGLWDDTGHDANPAVDDAGRIEIPKWRHAIVNWPHPLLRRGLTLFDTPGLNALGVEPELTLGLLPAAHAVVFVLGADTGVTRSDLELWRDHIQPRNATHLVVLNKIDALLDPLLDEAQIKQQTEDQRRVVAGALGIDVASVFALSARQALVARIRGDVDALTASGLPPFEAALGERLLGDGHGLMQHVLEDALVELRAGAAHRLGERRRQLAEQTLELRGLRGKSGARLRAARQRVATESADFDQCLALIRALHSVHRRLLARALDAISGESLHGEIDRLHQSLWPAVFRFNAKAGFVEFCARMRERLLQAQAGAQELQAMLTAGTARLNAEFGFALSLPPPMAMQQFDGELDLIESSYAQFLGVTRAWRLAQPRFVEQFKRMLLSKLRVVFESAGAEIEIWGHSAAAQIDAQLAERRAAFARRATAIGRIEQATGELEVRLAELAAQDGALQVLQRRLVDMIEALRAPVMAEGAGTDLRPQRLSAAQ
jgi:hypothetical protein